MFQDNQELAYKLNWIIDQLNLQLLKMEQKPNISPESNVQFLYQLLEGALFFDEYGLTSGSTPTDNPEQDLIDIIQSMLDATRQEILVGVLAFVGTLENDINNVGDISFESVENKIDELGLGILGLHQGLQSYIGYELQNLLDSLSAIESQTKGQLAGLILDSESIMLNAINTVQNSISSIVQQGIDYTSNLVIDIEDSLTNRISGSTEQLRKDIAKIGIKIESIDSGGDYTSAWTEGYIVDLLGVLSDGFNWLRSKDTNPTIINEINLPQGSGSIIGEDGTVNIGDVLNSFTLDGLLGDFFTRAIEGEIDGLEFRFEQLINIFNKVATNQYDSYEDLITDFNNVAGTGNITDSIIKVVLLIPAILSSVMSAINPFSNNIETLSRTVALDNLLSREELSELWIRELRDKDVLLEQFKRLGLSEENAKDIIITRTVQLQEQFLRELLLRDKINDEQFENGMFKLGYETGDIDKIKQTYFRIPPIPDLIRFAVREAYDENLAHQLQLDSGYDIIQERFEKDLRQNGLEPEYGRYYWRSHWDLPSPTQGYEMLHRGVINTDELRRLLKVSDYSPEWIDKLMEISYAPYTRVDIRRMHKENILSYDDVIKAYKDIGYNDERAKNLADFTVALNTTSTDEINKDLTTSQVLKAFTNNIIDDSSKNTLLRNIGYNDAEINVLTRIYELNLQSEQRQDITIDNKRRIVNAASKNFIEGTLSEQATKIYLGQAGYTDDEQNLEISTLKIERNLLSQSERLQTVQQSYIEYRMSDIEVRGVLSREGFTPVEENDIIALWNTQRRNRFKEPTKAELKKFYNEGHITLDEYRNYMSGIGFDNKLIDIYIESTFDLT